MTITLNSFDKNIASYNFTANKVSQSQQPAQAPIQAQEAVNDTAPKQKKSLWRGFRNFASGIQKFFISTGEYLKGAAKGVFFGGLSAAAIAGVSAVAKRTRDIKQFGDVMNTRALLKSPMKVPTKGKLIAGAVGVGILGINLFKSYLNANEKGANVDHRWNTGHKDK